MKYLYLILILFFSCSKSTKSIESKVKDSAALKSEKRMKQEENDCVFSTDFRGLTTDWLKEVGKENYVWIESSKRAAIPLHGDTIYVSKGGCVHFVTSVELILNNDNHTSSDSTFWIEKALNIAIEYEMKRYEQFIRERKFKKARMSEGFLSFEVDDDNIDDNKYYNGIVIKFNKNSKSLSLVQYSN